MTLLEMLWVAHLPAALGVLSYGVPMMAPETVGGDHRWPFSLASMASAAAPSVSSPASESVPLSPLQSLGNQARWDLQTTVDWQRWKNTATVTVVETNDAKADPSASDRQIPDLIHATCPAAHPHHPGAKALDLDLALDLAAVPAAVHQTMDGQSASKATRFVIRVKGVAIGQVGAAAEAEAMANDLRQAMPALSQRPQDLSPKVEGRTGLGKLQGQTVFSLPSEALEGEESVALATAQWVNNLRLALGADPLNPGQVQRVAYGLDSTSTRFQGTASWYGPYFHGRKTATGEIFDQEALTAAHKTLPFDTYLEVRNLLNDQTVVVRINDRGPYVGDRSLDLSYAAARCLGSVQVGVIPYEATILTPGNPHTWEESALPL